jgi:hypothetical protein
MGSASPEAATSSRITYYVALPISLSEEGDMTPGEAREAATPSAAVRIAEHLAREAGGAIAFSRTGDPAIGEFDDAIVLKTIGAVPERLDDILGEGRI